jgi:hypothetical protein
MNDGTYKAQQRLLEKFPKFAQLKIKHTHT